MRPKEIDRIESAIRHIQTSTDVDPWAAEIAVEAMQRDIPKKVTAKPEMYNKHLLNLYCPTCEKSTDVNPRAMEIAVEAMQNQIDHIAGSGKKVKQTFCSNCRNEAPEGKINSDCLMCMHLYGVHTQEANKEAAYESINFPKRDLFEPRKGIGESDKKVERTDESAQNVQNGDLIYRKTAIDALHAEIVKKRIANDTNDGMLDEFDTESVLRKLPPAQPERDTPQKPNKTTSRIWGIREKEPVCPKCGYYLGHWRFQGKRITYCEHCGQAIDWEGWDSDE